jgi:hypothetical protein
MWAYIFVTVKRMSTLDTADAPPYLFEIGFDLPVLLKAHSPEENGGKWIISGPVGNEHEEDYDKDILTKAGILSGMGIYSRLGKHVDLAHGYHKTKDMGFLIGRTVAAKDGPDGRLWIDIELYKNKTRARGLMEHLTSDPPGEAGLSIQGVCRGRDKKDNRRIIHTEIHMITVDPSPKGFTDKQILRVGATPGNGRSLSLLSKALSDAMGDYEILTEWSEFDEDTALVKANVMPTGVDEATPSSSCPQCGYTLKALTVGTGIVQDGDQGGAALKQQSLHGAVEQIGCAVCGARNKSTRKECRKCEHSLSKGISDPGVAAQSEYFEVISKALTDKRIINARDTAREVMRRKYPVAL